MGDDGQYYADADLGILYRCTSECEVETNWSEWIWKNDCSNFEWEVTEDGFWYMDDVA